jgi:hypothetical protein
MSSRGVFRRLIDQESALFVTSLDCIFYASLSASISQTPALGQRLQRKLLLSILSQAKSSARYATGWERSALIGCTSRTKIAARF